MARASRKAGALEGSWAYRSVQLSLGTGVRLGTVPRLWSLSRGQPCCVGSYLPRAIGLTPQQLLGSAHLHQSWFSREAGPQRTVSQLLDGVSG